MPTNATVTQEVEKEKPFSELPLTEVAGVPAAFANQVMLHLKLTDKGVVRTVKTVGDLALFMMVPAVHEIVDDEGNKSYVADLSYKNGLPKDVGDFFEKWLTSAAIRKHLSAEFQKMFPENAGSDPVVLSDIAKTGSDAAIVPSSHLKVFWNWLKRAGSWLGKIFSGNW
jgi:hypothetical protein